MVINIIQYALYVKRVDGFVEHIKQSISINGVIIGIILGGVFTYVVLTGKLEKGCEVEYNTELSPSTQDQGDIVVDLGGAVYSPGLYRVPFDYRIGDLLEYAGGIDSVASEEWVARNLNVAQKLADSQKVYVPFEWEITQEDLIDIQTLVKPEVNQVLAASVEKDISANQNKTQEVANDSSESGDSTQVDANTASLEELDGLKGIGQAYAQRIIDNRPYQSLTELYENSGVPKSTLEKLENLVVLN